jgi:hypothetical protein
MRTERNGKGQTKGNQATSGRISLPVPENFWKCTGFKGCCYFRWNSMDDTECYACGEPPHTSS